MMALHQHEWLRDVRRMAAFEQRRIIAPPAERATEQNRARQGGNHQIGKIAVREDLDHLADIADLAPAITALSQPHTDWRRLQFEHIFFAKAAQSPDRLDERPAGAKRAQAAPQFAEEVRIVGEGHGHHAHRQHLQHLFHVGLARRQVAFRRIFRHWMDSGQRCAEAVRRRDISFPDHLL